jgi:glycosyltransferase involved in cell wall biosynthesis
MKVSFVIPAFNEEKLLAATLRSVQSAAGAFHERGWQTELIVCNNNSTDRTAEVARAAGARVVFEPINQIARARNSGAAAASGDWLVFIDADSQASRELLAEAADAIASGRYVAGGANVRMDMYSPGLSFFCGLWNLLSRWKKWCAGSFIFCEAAAFRAIGGFSHELFASEELDLSERLKAYGRVQGKKLIILRKNRLLTSARKIHLYGHWGHLKFLVRAMLRPRATVRSREDCVLWYDGRR